MQEQTVQCGLLLTWAETPCEKSLLSMNDEDKRSLRLNRVKPLRSPQPKNLDWVILFSLIKLFFQVQASVYRLSVSALAATRLLGLGSKQHLSNIPRMLNMNTDLTQITPKVFLECSLRTADVFPVVASLPPKKLLLEEHLDIFMFFVLFVTSLISF